LTDSRVWGSIVITITAKLTGFITTKSVLVLKTLERFGISGSMLMFCREKREQPLPDHFHKFKNHSIILSSKKEMAMKGPMLKLPPMPQTRKLQSLHSCGSLLFRAKRKSCLGGEGRVALSLYDYVRLQLSVLMTLFLEALFRGSCSLIFCWGKRLTSAAKTIAIIPIISNGWLKKDPSKVLIGTK